jgi:hypothetical protein
MKRKEMTKDYKEYTTTTTTTTNDNNNNSIQISLRADITAQRPITKLARELK